MEQKFLRQCLMLCFSMVLLCMITGNFPSAEAYKNYTVGGSSGWFDKLAKPDVDYDKWAAGNTFSLGDFLIFNTDNNHSVIQTHNLATYSSCDAQGDDDVTWSTVQPNSTEVRPLTVAVPLTKEGAIYFFSGDYDGEQCMNGQKFAINVTHGQGLPPSLRDNPDLATGPTPANNDAPAPANDDDGSDDNSVPDTVVSSNFNHPKKVPPSSSDDSSGEEDTKGKSNGANFVPTREKFWAGLIAGTLVVSWIC